MTVADVIVAALRGAGVRDVFGVPGGGSSLDLIEAGRRQGLRFVLTATENAAAIAAMAQAEITGAPGVCLTGLGPGAASVLNGTACALLERAPLVVISDAHPASAAGCAHQRLDQRALFAPVVKWSIEMSAVNVEEAISRAIATAIARPCGPVHVDCPADVAGATVSQASIVSPQLQSSIALTGATGRLQPKPDDLELSAVRRPLLIAGLGAREHAGVVRAFSASLGVPVMVTYKAKGVLPDRDPRFAGVFTNGAIEREILDRADLLIAVGLDDVELLPRPWMPAQPVIEIEDDIDRALQQLGRRLIAAEWNVDNVPCAMAMPSRVGCSGDTLTPDLVVRLASAAFPSARVTVDAGAHMFPATLLWPIDEPGGMLISNGLSTMGFAVPAAIGAALAEPSRPVVALIGDGGLLMCAGELATLAREALPVVVIVFDDQSLSLIDVKQRQRRFARDGVGVAGVAWDHLARAFGLRAHAATTPGELEVALAAASAGIEPTLISARVDPASYGEMLRRIRG